MSRPSPPWFRATLLLQAADGVRGQARSAHLSQAGRRCRGRGGGYRRASKRRRGRGISLSPAELEQAADDLFQAEVSGRQIGLTSKAMQAALNIDIPDSGVLFDDMRFANCSAVPPNRFIQPRVEVEIAFVMKTPLAGEDVTRGDVIAATDYVAPRLEILDIRIQRKDATSGKVRKVCDTIADNTANAGIVLGEGAMTSTAMISAGSGRSSRKTVKSRKPASAPACLMIPSKASSGSPAAWPDLARRSKPARSSSQAPSPAPSNAPPAPMSPQTSAPSDRSGSALSEKPSRVHLPLSNHISFDEIGWCYCTALHSHATPQIEV